MGTGLSHCKFCSLELLLWTNLLLIQRTRVSPQRGNISCQGYGILGTDISWNLTSITGKRGTDTSSCGTETLVAYGPEVSREDK